LQEVRRRSADALLRYPALMSISVVGEMVWVPPTPTF
jgi:hypothetical protein